MTNISESLLSRRQVAARLGVCLRLVDDADFRRLMGLPAVRLGKRRVAFDPADVASAITRCKQAGLTVEGREDATV